MRPTTPIRLSALALAGALTLGACSDVSTDEGSATTAATEDTSATAGPDGDAADGSAETAGGAPDQAAVTVDTDDMPDPVAEVNGEQISKDTFLAAFETQRESARQQAEMGGMPVDETALRDDVIELLVDTELLDQESERLGLTASTEEIDAELEALVTQAGAPSTDELLDLLAEQGFDEQQVREELERVVLIDKLVAERGGVEDPQEQELKDYYEELTGQSADDEQVTADPGGAPAFDQMRDMLADQLTQEREIASLTALLEELRQDADITTHG
ncbi:SurA N-terminal domain-containing protein [Ornithinimicrobium pratense]|uniref:SurA n=1 Tax=Ornithinimicrobium pratense TaxID=2593973 RepID=A0A5J6V699_9MICO|nr:SurA N-terminal domain-containing protein [Ornithinimicrobium pratense]QFG69419.1 hypothetical protein FY030_12525 [Ornithinimicrobium pratense]